MNHSFDIEIAKEYGVNCAVILSNLRYWIAKNVANQENFYDGYYWTYNSVKAFEKLFPYLSAHQISTALKKLENNGIIISGNYNKMAYDQTKWYAITEKGFELLDKQPFCKNDKWNNQKCEMDFAKMENGITKNVNPIPNINTNVNTDVNTNNIYVQEFEKLWKLYPKKKGKQNALNDYIKARDKGTTFEEVEQGIQNYNAEIKAKGTIIDYVKDGSTYFHKHSWEDECYLGKEVSTNDNMGTDDDEYGEWLDSLERE